jgi:hypothetical protein
MGKTEAARPLGPARVKVTVQASPNVVIDVVIWFVFQESRSSSSAQQTAA